MYDPETRKVSVSRHVVFRERTSSNETGELITSEVEVVLPSPGRREVNPEPREQAADNEVAVDNARVGNDIVECVEVSDDDGPADAREAVERAGQQRQRGAGELRALRDRATIRTPERYREVNLAEHHVPTTLHEATTGPEAVQWTAAIRNELEAHDRNGTWKIIPRIPGKKIIDSRWVFKQRLKR